MTSWVFRDQSGQAWFSFPESTWSAKARTMFVSWAVRGSNTWSSESLPLMSSAPLLLLAGKTKSGTCKCPFVPVTVTQLA